MTALPWWPAPASSAGWREWEKTLRQAQGEDSMTIETLFTLHADPLRRIDSVACAVGHQERQEHALKGHAYQSKEDPSTNSG